MTTSVRVVARAWGATVETNGEELQLQPNEERDFHIEQGSQTFVVTQPAEAPAAPVSQQEEIQPEAQPQAGEVAGEADTPRRGRGSPTVDA